MRSGRVVGGEGAASMEYLPRDGSDTFWLPQGVVLYCILSGRDVPFASMTRFEIVKQRESLQHTAMIGDEWDHISGKLKFLRAKPPCAIVQIYCPDSGLDERKTSVHCSQCEESIAQNASLRSHRANHS